LRKKVPITIVMQIFRVKKLVNNVPVYKKKRVTAK